MNAKIEELKKLVRRLANDSYQNGLVDERDVSDKQQRKYADLTRQHQDDLMAGLDELAAMDPASVAPEPSDVHRFGLAVSDGLRRGLTLAEAELAVRGHAPAKSDELQKDAVNLLLALSDAWPYIHQWCTIESVKNRISKLLRKYGDFADLMPSSPLSKADGYIMFEGVDDTLEVMNAKELLRGMGYTVSRASATP